MDEKLIDKYIKYFYAASNYYGVIELDEFVDAYFKEKDYDDLYQIFFACFENKIIKSYKIKDNYYLTCYDKKGLKECLRLQEGKKLKVINKKELLKYAEIDYYEENSLTKYLKKNGVKEETIIDVLNNMSSIYYDFNKTLKFLIETCDKNINRGELIKIVKDTSNNIPMHANRGYSPNESTEVTNISKNSCS